MGELPPPWRLAFKPLWLEATALAPVDAAKQQEALKVEVDHHHEIWSALGTLFTIFIILGA
eukprot:11154147-Prorocentrum_lima.AAC.1